MSLDENTVHACLLVWSGSGFTSGACATKAGVRKARHFADRPITARSADRMGPLLECFHGSWPKPITNLEQKLSDISDLSGRA